MIGAGYAFALFAPGFAAAAEGDQVRATVDQPAVVTAAPMAEGQVAGQPARVVISVTGFRPPQDGGPVQGVVKLQGEGARPEREIGRFGLFPQAEFQTADPSAAQRFGFALPKELASGGPMKLNVYLVPMRGEGKGSSLELGGAEIH
jgi:hypothetical protein